MRAESLQIPIGNAQRENRLSAAILQRVQRLATRESRGQAIESEVFDALAQACAAKAPAFNAQDVSNTAWAFAKAGHHAPGLFDALAAEGSAERV